jgi:hypothetical protein
VWAGGFEKWRGLLAEQRLSAQSVAAFCRERSLSAAQFYAWKTRLSRVGAERFLPVRVAETNETAGGGSIEVRLGGGRSVIVAPGFDAGHLRAVLDVLERRA